MGSRVVIERWGSFAQDGLEEGTGGSREGTGAGDHCRVTVSVVSMHDGAGLGRWLGGSFD